MRNPSLALVLIAAAACGGSTPPTSTAPAGRTEPAARPSLYQRLGGQPAVEGVVREFVAHLAADPRIKFRFANSGIPVVTADLIDFVCMAAGGPCRYTGREMRVLHASMRVTEEEWDATVEALVGALDRFKVPRAEKEEVLGAVSGTKKDIVDPPADAPSGEERARIDAAAGDLARFGESAEILGAALAALRHGQRSYAEQLFSMAEETAGRDSLAALAPLFRAGGPPRITAAPTQMSPASPPQPKGAVGSSESDDPEEKPERGSLAGTLRLDGAPGGREAFGVVMLTPSTGAFRRRTAKHRVIEQRGREFAPRLMAVPVGSTVAFPNFDPIYHNVFSRSELRPFDLGIFKNAQSREITFDREGIVRVGCNLHANMSASIIVVSAPHYAVTDARGAFRFRSLRPGRYTLRAWTERSADPITRTIELKPGANRLEIEAPADRPRGTGQDKFGAPRGPSA